MQLQIGRMHDRNCQMRKVRGSVVMLTVNPDIAAYELLPLAVEKHSACNWHLPKHAAYRLLYPDGAGDAYFFGRHGKSCDSLNVQYITDKDGRVCHIITGLAGTQSQRQIRKRLRLRKYQLKIMEKILMTYKIG